MQINLLGETNHRNKKVKFGIKRDDRRRHIYILGKTGMGKSVLLENMAIQDIKNGEGVCFIDPHGDLAENLLNFIPAMRINDVIYFNPSDSEYPISFNPMENIKPEFRHLVCSGLVGVFKKIWFDSWGPRLEYILRNAILALLEKRGSTLLGIQRILVDDNFRKSILANVSDPVVKQFWNIEFQQMNPKLKSEAIAPIQNKVGQFLTSSLIRNIVGQPKSSFDVREVMDSQKILIVNLAKGSVGEDNAMLLGAMIVTKVYLSAMSRVDTAEAERKDFYMYVDEFQNFATEAFANVLSEARKYRLSLVLANQYLEQIIEGVRSAILGNCGTFICFRAGATDGETLERELQPFTEEGFTNLPKFKIYLRLLIDGIAGDAFSANTLPPCEEEEGNGEKIIRQSRERYCRSRKEVEEKINRWANIS